jgi:aminoglycoside phosphotransferase (APT) family kinase protein
MEIAGWDGPPIWLHGDLHPFNLVVNQGRLSAVIDFGDLCAGDPATDLAVAWMLFPWRCARSSVTRSESMPIRGGGLSFKTIERLEMMH